MGECMSISKRVEPERTDEPVFVRPKTAVPKRVGTAKKPVENNKPMCPRCNRNDRVTEASRYADKAFFDSGFMSDYYYGFGSARWHTGERTRFCFFRPDKSDVAYICDVKHA